VFFGDNFVHIFKNIQDFTIIFSHVILFDSHHRSVYFFHVLTLPFSSYKRK
jgi:hypothetical protein